MCWWMYSSDHPREHHWGRVYTENSIESVSHSHKRNHLQQMQGHYHNYVCHKGIDRE